jgi:hypothetical protein
MTNVTAKPAADWLGSVRTNVLAWWLPVCAMLAGLFVATPPTYGDLDRCARVDGDGWFLCRGINRPRGQDAKSPF